MAEPADLDLPWTRAEQPAAFVSSCICGVLGPLIALYTRRRVTGHEHLDGLDGPVVFVANHSSHMDTPVLLRALPWRWRRRTAVAAAADYFYDAPLALAASLAFGTVPLDRTSGAGAGPRRDRATSTACWASGWQPAHLSPRARARRDGTRRAAAHRAPRCSPPSTTCRSCPIYVSGTHEAMPLGRRWMVFRPGGGPAAPARGPLRAADPSRARASTGDVMERVRLFLALRGARDGTPSRAPSTPTEASRPDRGPRLPDRRQRLHRRRPATRLVERGDEVRAARPLRRGGGRVAARGGEPVRGDLLDEEALAPAWSGCALAYHVAGVNTHCPDDPDELMHVNVGGTETALRAAARAGIAARGLHLLGGVGRRAARARSAPRTRRTAAPTCRCTTAPSTRASRPRSRGRRAARRRGRRGQPVFGPGPGPRRAATGRSSSPTSTAGCRRSWTPR